MAITPNRPSRFSQPIRLAGGYQTGNLTDIAARYSPSLDAGASNFGNIASARTSGFGALTPPPSRLTPRPLTGSTGDTGSLGSAQEQYGPPAPPVTPQPAQGIAPPPGNATQRWTAGNQGQEEKQRFMDKGGSEHTYNQARVAQGVRPMIDARATPDPKASTASAEIRKQWGWNQNSSMDLPY